MKALKVDDFGPLDVVLSADGDLIALSCASKDDVWGEKASPGSLHLRRLSDGKSGKFEFDVQQSLLLVTKDILVSRSDEGLKIWDLGKVRWK